MTLLDFLTRLKVPGADRALVPLAPHLLQREFCKAYERVGPDGLPVYRELLALWVKKSGKSSTCAAVALFELLFGQEHDREIIIAASDADQARDAVFREVRRFVRRDPVLQAQIRLLKNEAVYVTTSVDPRTGATLTETHVIRVVAGRDTASLHGGNQTLLIADETWALEWALLEALSPSAARRSSRTIYASYQNLRTRNKAGIPLYDILARRGKDPALYVSEMKGEAALASVPWFTPAFIASERRRLAAVPSRFSRLYLNVVTGGDLDAFISQEELADAIDATLVEPRQGVPGIQYFLGVDLGVKRDMTGVAVGHLDAGTFIVDALRVWRGTKSAPVKLLEVELAILELANRFNVSRVILDAWQGLLLAENLRRALPRAHVEVVAVTSKVLAECATTLKGVFVQRAIRMPNHAELVSQLEDLAVEELKQRDQVRFINRHDSFDDLVFALSLAMRATDGKVGRVGLPDQNVCYREVSIGRPEPCYLWENWGYFPTGCPSCKACPSHVFIMKAAADAGIEPREFRAVHARGDNRLTARKRADAGTMYAAIALNL